MGFPDVLIEQGQGLCVDLWRPSHEKKFSNKGKTSISKFTFLRIEKCEHCGVKGHDIDHCYSLHLELHPNKSTNNKNGKGKGGCGGSNGSQGKGKVTSKTSSKTNLTKVKVLA